MAAQPPRFLQGIVLAADLALPSTKRKVLLTDAVTLAAETSLLHCSENISPECALATARLVTPWLSYRKAKPSGGLTVGVAARVDKLAVDAAKVAEQTSSRIIPDEDLSALVSGAQSAIKVLGPDVSDTVFLEDWRELGNSYEKLMRQYRSNGVPEEGIRELLTLEYTNARLRSGLSIGVRLRDLFSGGGWYGWLEVHTVPEPADVHVDKDDWGESPKGQGVPAGKHVVSARKASLKGELEADVPVVGSKRVDLVLT